MLTIDRNQDSDILRGLLSDTWGQSLIDWQQPYTEPYSWRWRKGGRTLPWESAPFWYSWKTFRRIAQLPVKIAILQRSLLIIASMLIFSTLIYDSSVDIVSVGSHRHWPLIKHICGGIYHIGWVSENDDSWEALSRTSGYESLIRLNHCADLRCLRRSSRSSKIRKITRISMSTQSWTSCCAQLLFKLSPHINFKAGNMRGLRDHLFIYKRRRFTPEGSLDLRQTYWSSPNIWIAEASTYGSLWTYCHCYFTFLGYVSGLCYCCHIIRLPK